MIHPNGPSYRNTVISTTFIAFEKKVYYAIKDFAKKV